MRTNTQRWLGANKQRVVHKTLWLLCFGKLPLGSVCSDADVCDISAAGVCDCAVRTLGEMESRPRPHVALRRCKTSAIRLLLLLLRQRVRQGARMKEAFIKAQPICCYPALIEHKSQQRACWDNKSLSGLETWFNPHVKSASLERAVNHTELSMQINFSKVFYIARHFQKKSPLLSHDLFQSTGQISSDCRSSR